MYLLYFFFCFNFFLVFSLYFLFSLHPLRFSPFLLLLIWALEASSDVLKNSLCFLFVETFLLLQSLKRSTFSFLSSLTVRLPSVQHAFIVRSSIVHRSLIVQSFAFTVQKAFIVRSSCVQLPFTKRSSFAHRSQGVQPFLFGTPTRKDCLKPSFQNSDKIRRNVCRRMGENVFCILAITLFIKKRQDY